MRSYLEHRGYFSEFKNTFRKSNGRVSVLMSYSFPLKFLESETQALTFEDTTIPLSLIEKTLVLISPEMGMRDIETIFSFFATTVFNFPKVFSILNNDA